MQEMRVPALGWEDPLEEETATFSSILAWETPWTEEEPGGLQSMELQKSRTQVSNSTTTTVTTQELPTLEGARRNTDPAMNGPNRPGCVHNRQSVTARREAPGQGWSQGQAWAVLCLAPSILKGCTCWGFIPPKNDQVCDNYVCDGYGLP